MAPADLGALGLIDGARRVDEETQDQGRDRSDETGAQPDDVPGMVVEVMVGQPAAQQHTDDRTGYAMPQAVSGDPDGRIRNCLFLNAYAGAR